VCIAARYHRPRRTRPAHQRHEIMAGIETERVKTKETLGMLVGRDLCSDLMLLSNPKRFVMIVPTTYTFILSSSTARKTEV
jgi:hypothetical protein